jgi:hypothetical protein
MRPRLPSAGTWLVVLIALAIGLTVAFSVAMNLAADDLRGQFAELRGSQPEMPRNAIGRWLSARMASDIAPDDAAAIDGRDQDLTHRAERTRELAAAASLAGLVLALGTARPEAASRRAQSARSGLANTRSNGTV